MKLFAVISSFLFLAISTGFSVNLHYCGGKVNSISLSVEKIGCCCKEKMALCCGDETISVKYDSKVISAVSTPKIQLPTLINLLFSTQLHSIDDVFDTNIANIIQWQKPPPKSEPLYISLVRLTYYG